VLELLADNALRLFALVLLLVGSAFFSGTETALFNLTRHQLNAFAAGVNPLQRLAARLMRHPEHTLVSILLGNMTINVLFFAIASVFVIRAADHLAGWQATLMTFVPLLAIIFFGEVLPKTVALTYPSAFATLVAGPMLLFDQLVAPLRAFFQRFLVMPGVRLLTPAEPAAEPVSPDELRELLAQSSTRGILAPDESSLLQEVVELHSIRAREIVVPRVDMTIFDVTGSREAFLDLARKTKLNRIPAYRDEPDNIVGLLRTRDVLVNPHDSLENLLEPAWFIPEMKPIDDLLREFQDRGLALAITVDEHGGVTGIVSLEDVVEELVGDVFEEPGGPPPEPVVRINDDTYVLSGQLSIREWAQAFGQRFTNPGVTTIAGLITARLGRLACVNDSVMIRNLRFVVTRVRRNRIVEARVERLGEIPIDEATGAEGDR
jgi:putative hemolysin